MVFTGYIAFACFFLADLNDWRFGKRYLRFFFPLGILLLVFSTLMQCIKGSSDLPIVLRISAVILACVFLFLLVFTLFFALPVNEAYMSQGEKRRACTVGVYALCRHPGVLWFAGLYLCLSASFSLSLFCSALYILLNVLLVLFEDFFVFPSKLCGYAKYRLSTPFLIPNKISISKCINYYKH